MERKKPIKKNHIKEFGGRDAPEASQGQTRDVPGTPGIFWAWFVCKSILKGQNVPGTDGTYHGRDVSPGQTGHKPGGVPPKILYVYCFFSFPNKPLETLNRPKPPWIPVLPWKPPGIAPKSPRNLDVHIASDFKSNPAIWNRSKSNHCHFSSDLCDPSDHLKESLGPPGPKSQKSLKKSLLGGLQKKSPKISAKVEKYPKKSNFGYFSTFTVIFGDFLADPRKDSFRDSFLRFWGPEGPETPCKWVARVAIRSVISNRCGLKVCLWLWGMSWS